jgi:hypothetical protein
MEAKLLQLVEENQEGREREEEADVALSQELRRHLDSLGQNIYLKERSKQLMTEIGRRYVIKYYLLGM